MFKLKYIYINLAVVCSLILSNCYALSFDISKKHKNDLVGEVQTTSVRNGEDFSDVAKRFDIGYYEIFEANPDINPDTPPKDTILVIPTQYILPSELKDNTAVINLAEMRLYYKNKDGDKVYIFPIAIGKEDWETPTGKMSIVDKVKNPTWTVPESIYKFRESIGDKVQRVVPPGPNNPLGKYAIRLSQREYLIHGTNIPAGVGRRSTAGCIRLYNEDIEQLFNLVNIGTKVTIMNKPYKVGLSGNKLYLEAHMPLLEQRILMGDDVKPALDVLFDFTKGHNIANIKINWEKVRNITREHLVIPRKIS